MTKSLFLYLVLLSVVSFHSNAFSQSDTRYMDSAALSVKSVCLLYQKADGPFTGSGCLVKKDRNYFLVTAAHNTSGTVLESLTIFFDLNGDIKRIPAMLLVDSNANVKTSTGYDLAVVKLSPFNEASRQLFDSVAILYSMIAFSDNIYLKGQPVFAAGYIDIGGNGMTGQPKPLRFFSSIESGLQKFPRADTQQETKLCFLADNAPKGTSGGPVFAVKPTSQQNKYTLIGIIEGSVADTQMKWHASVTPVSDLQDLLKDE